MVIFLFNNQFTLYTIARNPPDLSISRKVKQTRDDFVCRYNNINLNKVVFGGRCRSNHNDIRAVTFLEYRHIMVWVSLSESTPWKYSSQVSERKTLDYLWNVISSSKYQKWYIMTSWGFLYLKLTLFQNILFSRGTPVTKVCYQMDEWADWPTLLMWKIILNETDSVSVTEWISLKHFFV